MVVFIPKTFFELESLLDILSKFVISFFQNSEAFQITRKNTYRLMVEAKLSIVTLAQFWFAGPYKAIRDCGSTQFEV